jgi:hypothetical protein
MQLQVYRLQIHPNNPTRPHGKPSMKESEKVMAKKTFSSET